MCRTTCCKRVTSGLLLTSLSPEKLPALVNAVPIRLIGTAPLARGFSTAGGVALDELDADFMIRRLPGVFAAGEMLDWEGRPAAISCRPVLSQELRRAREH